MRNPSHVDFNPSASSDTSVFIGLLLLCVLMKTGHKSNKQNQKPSNINLWSFSLAKWYTFFLHILICTYSIHVCKCSCVCLCMHRNTWRPESHVRNLSLCSSYFALGSLTGLELTHLLGCPASPRDFPAFLFPVLRLCI